MNANPNRKRKTSLYDKNASLYEEAVEAKINPLKKEYPEGTVFNKWVLFFETFQLGNFERKFQAFNQNLRLPIPVASWQCRLANLVVVKCSQSRPHDAKLILIFTV